MKKILILFLSIICIFSLTLGFIACDEPTPPSNPGENSGGNEDGGDNDGQGQHPNGPTDTIPFACTYQDGAYTITGIGNVSGFEIAIPDQIDGVPVTKIGASAFANSIITKVTIGNNVTEIGEKAFYYSDLKEIIFGENVTSLGKECFSYSKLTEVSIPEKLTEISESAFFRCYYLKKAVIPDNVTVIKNKAFANSGSSSVGKKLVIEGGNKLVEIGENAFENCAISSFNFVDTIEIIRSTAFSTSKIEEVVLPKKLKNLNSDVFNGCSMLKSVTLNTELESIGASVFKNCGQLSTLNFAENGKLSSIGNGSFYGCSALKLLEIPDSVQRLEVSAFAKCTGLEKVIIGTGVSFIGAGCFSYDYENYVNDEPYNSDYRMLDYLEFKSPDNWIQSTNPGASQSELWWPADTPENTAKHYHTRRFFNWMKGTQVEKTSSTN